MTAGGLNSESIVATLRAHLSSMCAVYLFGSHARGDATRESDVDLAVLADHPSETQTLSAARQELELALQRDVHLVDLLTATTVLRAEVIRTGIVLLDERPSVRQAFEARAFSQYAHLNEERRDILADIARRGRVYG